MEEASEPDNWGFMRRYFVPILKIIAFAHSICYWLIYSASIYQAPTMYRTLGLILVKQQEGSVPGLGERRSIGTA